MVAPPLKVSDFFGNLSVSGSPYGWSAWFIFFATLVFRENSSFFQWMYTSSCLAIAFLIWRSAYDSVETADEKSLRSELRFVAGTGIGGTLLALAGSLDQVKNQTYDGAILIIAMSSAMLL